MEKVLDSEVGYLRWKVFKEVVGTYGGRNRDGVLVFYERQRGSGGLGMDAVDVCCI